MDLSRSQLDLHGLLSEETFDAALGTASACHCKHWPSATALPACIRDWRTRPPDESGETTCQTLATPATHPYCITDKQRVWIAEYVIDMNGTRTARVAGYAHPDVAAAKLLNPVKYPLVAAEVKKAIARKELVADRKADDVLRFIHNVMWFCPAPLALTGPMELGRRGSRGG